MSISNTKIYQRKFKSIVFLHYFGGSETSWKWVIDRLKDDYECIALNLPGFGNSKGLKTPSIENFGTYVMNQLSRLEIGSYVIVGHSMGAKIAMQMAANDVHNKVEQLILIAPSPPGTEPIEDDEKSRMLKHPNLQEAKTTLNKITKLPLNEQQQELAVENNLAVDNVTWNWWLKDGMNRSIADQMKSLKLPITILNSEDDPVITPTIIEKRILNVFPEAKLVTLKNAGHLIPMENPEWIANQIKSVVSK